MVDARKLEDELKTVSETEQPSQNKWFSLIDGPVSPRFCDQISPSSVL